MGDEGQHLKRKFRLSPKQKASGQGLATSGSAMSNNSIVVFVPPNPTVGASDSNEIALGTLLNNGHVPVWEYTPADQEPPETPTYAGDICSLPPADDEDL